MYDFGIYGIFQKKEIHITSYKLVNMQYNYAKMQVLLAIKVCQMKKVDPVCEILAELSDEPKNIIYTRIGRYCKTGYIIRKLVRGTSKFMYTLSKKGTKTLEQYLDRYHRGLSLNLRWSPKPVDFKDGGKPLPGLVLHDTDVNEKDNGT